MNAPVFISYSHADQKPTDWLARLQLYLAQARRAGSVDSWDDRRIAAGSDWRAAIDRALADALAAVLLVGPGFLGSEFIRTRELPILLTAARARGLRILPLVTGWCDYENSELSPFQAFNDWKEPLEGLATPDQNRKLNAFSVEVSRVVGQVAGLAAASATATAADLRGPAGLLIHELDLSSVAFLSQNRRCRSLVEAVIARLQIREHLEFERFLFRHHAQMTAEELFEFRQIRAVTDGPLARSNQRMLELLLDHPALLEAVPELTELRQHLVFWLNKYERVFQPTEAMAVCYVGVEDGVPWPTNAENAVREWVRAHP